MKHADTALWLYGSNARGDADSQSDFDMLAITDSTITNEEVASITGSNWPRLRVSRYGWSEIEGMASYGSLFLHHIRLEGKRLFEGRAAAGRLKALLDALGPYRRAHLDVAAFRISVDDARASLGRGGSIPFELSVLSTVLRHSAILGCYVSGIPTFGRFRPVQRIADLWKLDQEIASLFEDLYRNRLWADQRAEKPTEASLATAYHWCDRIDTILEQLEEQTNEFERRVS